MILLKKRPSSVIGSQAILKVLRVKTQLNPKLTSKVNENKKARKL